MNSRIFAQLTGNKIVNRNSGLFQEGSYGPLGKFAGMVDNSGVAPGYGVVPDLATAHCLAVKNKAEFLKSLNKIPVFDSG